MLINDHQGWWKKVTKTAKSTGSNVSSEVVTAEASISHPISAASRHCNPKQGSSSQAAEPGDLGVERPNQIVLKTFPARLFSGKKILSTVPGMVAEAACNTSSRQTLHSTTHAESS